MKQSQTPSQAHTLLWGGLATLPLIMALLIAGCSQKQSNPGTPRAELRVLCGSSMAEPGKVLAQRFEESTGIHIDLTLGGTETLLPQVELGVAADIFIGHAPFADLLKEKGLREDDLANLGALRPTLVVTKGNPKNIKALSDLTRKDVRVGLPDARYATCGQFFETTATKLQLLEGIQNRTVYTARTHQELATALRTGSVDAIVVWNFIAAQQRAEFESVPLDVDFPSAEVFATVLKKAASPEHAKRFLDFLNSDSSRQTFAEMGYTNAAIPSAASGEQVSPGGNGGKVLKLYCAAGVQQPADEIAALFKTRHDGVQFEVVYQGSGTLLAQIGLSKSGDLYIAGDEFFMDQARAQGLVTHAERMAMFTPVLAVPKGNPRQIASLEDLLKEGVKLGLGDEKAAAVGKVSREWLIQGGVWPAAEKNVAVTAGTVDQLAIQTALGNLDAAIIWDATAWQFKDRVEVVLQADASLRVGVPVGVLKFSGNPDLAEDFIRFATSPEAAAILQKNGFQPATETPAK